MDSGHIARQVVDIAVYAVVVTGVLVAASGVLALLLGAGAVGFKRTLFLVGVGAVGYATLGLRPTPPGRDRRDEGESGDPGDGRTDRDGDTGGDHGDTARRGTEEGGDAEGDGVGPAWGGGFLTAGVRTLGGPSTSGSTRSTRSGGSVAARIGDSLPDSVRLPPDERLPGSVKLLVAGLVVLGVSYVLEAGFGVGP